MACEILTDELQILVPRLFVPLNLRVTLVTLYQGPPTPGDSIPAASLQRKVVWHDPRWATFCPHCGVFWLHYSCSLFWSVRYPFLKEFGPQIEPKWDPKWSLNRSSHASCPWLTNEVVFSAGAGRSVLNFNITGLQQLLFFLGKTQCSEKHVVPSCYCVKLKMVTTQSCFGCHFWLQNRPGKALGTIQ